jgi:hypothetical protein
MCADEVRTSQNTENETRLRVCSRCGVEKVHSSEFFYKKKGGKYGLACTCIACSTEINLKWQSENKERIRELERIRREKKREEQREEKEAKRKARHEEALARRPAYQKAWRAEHAEELRQCKHEWYLNNKHRIKVDKPKINARRRERAREDPSIRLHSNISRALRDSITFRKNRTSWQEILGYTTAELVRHIERQFNRWMSWDNYGDYWHIDHIIPLSSFPRATSKDDPNLKAAWALSNLRPLKWKANQEKSDQRLHLL